jgi:hypothetical protein
VFVPDNRPERHRLRHAIAFPGTTRFRETFKRVARLQARVP